MAAAESGSSHLEHKGARSRATLIFAATVAAAAILYAWRLGGDSLGASESYSAWAASHSSVSAIVGIPVLYDPGKQILYYVLLHFWAIPMGHSETALRSLSVIFALVAIFLLFAIGRRAFGAETAAAGAAIWAFTPTAVVYAHRARMYSMYAAVGLAHLYAFQRVRDRPTRAWAAVCAILGAVLLYTHVGAIVLIGAEFVILVRDLTRGRRNPYAWIALGAAMLIFAPWAPVLARQSHELVEGHWLDWIGVPHHYSILTRAIVVAASAALTIWLAFGRPVESGKDEPIRWCATLAILPIAAFAAGSIVVRPMFNLRYVAPSLAVLALAAAATLDLAGSRVRNLGTAAIVGAMLFLVPVMRPVPQKWREIAAMVAASNPRWPVFIESGFVAPPGVQQVPNGGFPFGYYAIPFGYYFHGANPRVIVAGFDPAAARTTISQRAGAAGGGWLITWKTDAADARMELPPPAEFSSTPVLHAENVVVYRIAPAGAAGRAAN
jgi:4-amino-4-deoxy-L-arabinose transferase-like glycosyltransferase